MKPLTQVKSSSQWEMLVEYYRECLLQENRQGYTLESRQLEPFSKEDISGFVLGETSLNFNFGERLAHTPMAKFLNRSFDNSKTRLCFGYSFFVHSANEVTPLIYVHVEIEKAGNNSFSLQVTESEDIVVSRAFLDDLESSEGETDELETTSLPKSRQDLETTKDLLFSKIDNAYQRKVPRVLSRKKISAGTIYDYPAFFTVEKTVATKKLIQDLDELSNKNNWEKVSPALKQLLSVFPEHDYPKTQDLKQDMGVYVTAVNQRQLKAVQSVRKEPVVVITGPPGTGKSQLVLNLIIDAFLANKKVLFASYNNKAVDVVMERLQNEIKFQGAVRTGNSRNKRVAAAQMKKALNHINTQKEKYDLSEIQSAYLKAHQNAVQAQDELDKLRELIGLLESHEQEKILYLKYLPKKLRQLAKKTTPKQYKDTEFEKLQSVLSKLREDALEIKQENLALTQEWHHIKTKMPSDYPLIAEIHRMEQQWGVFGDGFVQNNNYEESDAFLEHLENWRNLVFLVEKKQDYKVSSKKVEQLLNALSKRRKTAQESIIEESDIVSKKYSLDNLKELYRETLLLREHFVKFSAKENSFWYRFRNLITFGSFFRKEMYLLDSFEQRLGISNANLYSESGDIGVSVEIAENLRLLVFVTAYRKKVEFFEKEIARLEKTLPDAIYSDIDKLQKNDFENTQLKLKLNVLLSKAKDNQTKTTEFVEHIKTTHKHNIKSFSVVEALKDDPISEGKELWGIDTLISPVSVEEHVKKWQNLVSFWNANAKVIHSEKNISSLPTEDEILEKQRNVNAKMKDLSGQIVRATWIERAKDISNETFQKAHDYVTAIGELAQRYDLNTYRKNKSIEENNLYAAMEVFPIWATTSLSTRSNFPLESNYFDLVIIDEASQCDMPSALPLLYRGKDVVIIGDPHQLRHIATLSKKADQDLASGFDVDYGAFSYSKHSLYDIAQRSSGSHPGALLLSDHYRSDTRIIDFSNQEFYDGELKIKTDLTQQGLRKTFLNQFGGMFWVNVKGEATHPQGGSLYNNKEAVAINDLLPRLLARIENLDIGNRSIGIVTPYRAQADLIEKQVLSQYGTIGDITVGTAHKFQGDEKDFMIFSPVVAKGVSQGSLGWLQQTKNLLNVAVTRARISLIVVGNLDFCKNLEAEHVFRHLAEYVSQQPNKIVDGIEQLPLLDTEPVDIVGYITNPHNPEHSRTTLNNFLSSCSEFIWWADPYFSTEVFDLFLNVFQNTQMKVQDVRLLVEKDVTFSRNGRKPQLDLKTYAIVQTELKARGVKFELRLLKKYGLPHDRLLYAPNTAINMPPFGGAYGKHEHISEYTRSGTTKKIFIEHWEKAEIIAL